MNKKDFIKIAVAKALARIVLAEQRLAALDFSCQRINQKRQYFGKKTEKEASAIREGILEEYHEALMDLYMWGILGDKQAHKEAAKIAAKQFIDEHQEIMSLLEISGLPPWSYSTTDHDDFRKQVLQLIEDGKIIKTEKKED